MMGILMYHLNKFNERKGEINVNEEKIILNTEDYLIKRNFKYFIYFTKKDFYFYKVIVLFYIIIFLYEYVLT